MNLSYFVVGILGFFFCGAFGTSIDRLCHHLSHRLRRKVAPEILSSQLQLTRELLRQLRSGRALETALNDIREKSRNDIQLTILKEISAKAPREPLSQLLTIALESGCSILVPLSAYAENLQKILQIRAKIQALTSQARAQATVLSFLPVFLLCSLAFLDPTNFLALWRTPETAFIGALFLFFLGGGKFWIQRLQTNLFVSANVEEEIEFDILPKFTLQWAMLISAGIDPQTAFERCALQIPQGKSVSFSQSARGKFFHHLLEQSINSGTPIKEELLQFLDEHLQMLHCSWEEKAHQLPVKLLAPLFLCYLPACFLSLAAFFLPLWRQL
jgi:hypothetical protein